MLGEKLRAEEKKDEIEKAREDIIFKHKACKGKGMIVKAVESSFSVPDIIAEKCKCRKKFEFMSRLILSNISYWNLKNQEIFGRTVVDVDSGENICLRNDIAIPFINNIKKVINHPYGLLFLGKNGTGKTFVGQKILYYAIQKKYLAHYIEFTDFLKLLRRNFDHENSLDNLIKEISDVDILMVDEIGNESKRSEFVIGEFKSLFKRRILRNKPTILVTNYSYDEFKTEYGSSITSIVEAYSKKISFKKAKDMRQQDKVKMNNFLRNLDK